MADVTWLAASNGSSPLIGAADFSVESLMLDCVASTPQYSLLFSSPYAGDPVEVEMGDGTREWLWQVADEPWRVYVRNLRSFDTGIRDDYEGDQVESAHCLAASPDIDLGG